jgi:hypothetical protein
MQNSDDFIIVVPTDGEPELIPSGGDLPSFANSGFVRVSKTVALNSTRAIKGSIYRARETTGTDELRIMELLREAFS